MASSKPSTASEELREHRKSWSWRRREGLGDYEGELDVDTLELVVDVEREQTSRNISGLGLTSQQAYDRLFDAIREELALFNKVNTVHWTTDILNTLRSSRRSPMGWISLIFLLVEVLLMIFTYGLSSSGRLELPLAEGLLILLLTAMNLALCVREERLSRTEMSRSTQCLLEQCEASCGWMPSDYVDPCTPPSPSISLASSYRDGTIISVPKNLLVQGDVIVLGPSDTAPTQVQQLHTQTSGHGSLLVLEAGEAFDPPLESRDGDRVPGRAEACQPHPREKFLVLETPIKSTLRNILYSSRKRPDTVLANEMHHITKTVTGKCLVWIVLIISLIVNIIRTVLMAADCGEWSEMILLLQAYVLLPLLPLSFPMVWILLNLYGIARIKAVFNALREGTKVENPPLREVLILFWNNLLGDPSTLPRTANLLQTLGNITVWCCVDKEGILSLPNPQAEKVFFLRSKKLEHRAGMRQRKQRKESTCTWSSDMSRSSEHLNSSPSLSSSSSSEDEVEEMLFGQESEFGTSEKGHREILNLSADPESQFGLRFDDVRWQDHLNSLKPLGLNILLNSCCSSPVRCLRFADCTGHLSLHHNNMPAPAQRRCMCLLGKEIGFMEQALHLFRRQKFIFAMQPSVTRSSAFRPHSFLSICKDKAVPNMMCLVAREVNTGSLQLLSQGSADLVLDACTDFWDGHNLCPMTPHERKKALDFYHRSSMSAYCVTFAYRPVNENLCEFDPRDAFLELPCVTNWHYGSASEDTASTSDISDAESKTDDSEDQTFDDVLELTDEPNVESLLEKVDIAQDVDSYERILGGQVFIGMVTLQYQAKKDIIPLVEDLNNAGVRFVYFSSENELRSRVFAERMGLETGWNCHISLSEGHTVHWEEQSSTATASERNDESLVDVRGADGEAQETTDEKNDEKHVTWMADAENVAGQESKLDRKEHGIRRGEHEPLLESSQMSTNDDLWFFSNRAKLPRGVHNIRPHLEKVDNVPLLVPMFTDCSPQAIREMIAVMQEYGEVVCCVGSSFNVNNTDIFAQADMSIAIEPLFPQLCLKGLPKDFRSGTPQLGSEHTRHKLGRKFSGSAESGESELSPLELSALLNSLPCCLSFHRDVEFKFSDLLQESRRFCFGLRVCFTFLLSCQLLLSAVELLSSFFLLPPPLNGLHLLWMSCLTVPLLSLSLIGAPLEGSLMTTLTGKNDKNFKDIMLSFCWYFLLGFLPCAFMCSIVLFPLTLRGFCAKIHRDDHTKCHFLLGFRNNSELWNGLASSHSQALALAQDVNALFLVVFFGVMSSSYVHRLHLLWKKSPFVNKQWKYSVLIILALQLIYFVVSQAAWNATTETHYSITDLPDSVVVVFVLWPVVSIGISELIKRRYIKFWIRYQKRAKLQFGTKLGMNSPF